MAWTAPISSASAVPCHYCSVDVPHSFILFGRWAMPCRSCGGGGGGGGNKQKQTNNINTAHVELKKKTKVMPVIIGVTGTTSKSLRQYLSNTQGKREIK